MADNEFKVGHHTYRAGRLDARKQFDVARRLSYVLVQLGAEKKADFKPSAENFARIILVTTGYIPQADMDAALNICLSVVKRHIPGDIGWAALTASNGALMYEDIGMAEMLQIVWHVISMHRLVDFLAASAQDSSEA
jgi:hypothetical protein